MTIFRKKNSFRRLKFLMTSSLVIDPYDSFLDEKPLFQKQNSFMAPFLTRFVLSHASNNTTFQNIVGDGCIGVPHLKFWGRTVPSPPLSLRPCSSHSTSLYQLL